MVLFVCNFSFLGCQSNIDQSKVDPVIKIISAILRLADTENKALSSNMAHCLSPQVGSTVVWFLRHFSKSYLLPNEHEYDQLGVTLSSVFGQDTIGGKWTIGFLLEKVKTNLIYWSSEPALAEDTVLLLLSLVDSKKRFVIHFPFFLIFIFHSFLASIASFFCILKFSLLCFFILFFLPSLLSSSSLPPSLLFFPPCSLPPSILPSFPPSFPPSLRPPFPFFFHFLSVS